MHLHRSALCVFFSSRRRHTRYWRDWSSDVCSSDLDINWYRNGKFEDPTRYLTPQQLQKVYLFIKNLNQNLAQFESMINSYRNGKKNIALSGFKGMARDWENELEKKGNSLRTRSEERRVGK